MTQIHPTDDDRYSLLILAGGEGRRMEGRDKGLQLWRGKPLIEHLIDKLCPGYQQRLISCNRNLPQYSRYGIAFSDSREGFQGPMAGIEAGLQRATEPLVLVLPCDCPDPPPALYQRLHHAMKLSGKNICYARQGERDQYLFALIKRQQLASLQRYLASGQRSVRHWYSEQGAAAVDFGDASASFLNYNTLAALADSRPGQ